MPKLTLELETVTPLFMAGAEPDTGAELRPSSFRGAMRYWLRAWAGATSIGHNLDKLRSSEARIFGDAGQTGASTVVVIIKTPDDFRYQRFSSQRPPSTPQWKSSGHDYLFWSMKRSGNKPDRWAVEPNQRFSLVLGPRPGAENADKAFRQGAVALWLLTHLGGLGSRSRRTGGSLQAVKASGNPDLPPFVIRSYDGQELARELETGLAVFRQAAGKSVKPTRGFDVLHPDVCRIWVVAEEKPWTDWLDAVQGIGSQLRNFRSQLPPKERQVFGLPLQKVSKDRRASPVHLRVTRLRNGTMVGVVVLFMSQFQAESDRPDYTRIEEFVGVFSKQWEVTGW